MIAKFVATLLLIGPCQSAPAPQLQSWISALQQTYQNYLPSYQAYQNYLPAYQNYQNYLPEKVQEFLQETMNDGSKLMDQLYEDIQNEVLTKVSDNMEEFEEAYEIVVEQILNLFEKYQNMVMQQMSMSVISEEELSARISGLKESRERLSVLKMEVQEEMEMEEGEEEGMEKTVQSILSNMRFMLAEMFESLEVFNKMYEQLTEQAEAAEIETIDVLATYIGKMKKIYKNLFENLGEVEWQNIGSSVGQPERQPKTAANDTGK